MSKIIYIHHYFSKSLFYKIAHNTTDREYHIDNNDTGYIITKYKNNKIKFVFDPTIHYKDDGFHIIDYFSAFLQKNIDTKFKNITINGNILDIDFLTSIGKLLKEEKNWIILFFRTEKIIGKYEENGIGCVDNIEYGFEELKQHHIVSDNFFINTLIKNKYPNHFFSFTSVIYQWNEYISIRWYYEYKNIFEKLNHPYDLCFSMRHHKKNRIDILNGLSKLNNDKLYLSKVDHSRLKKHIKSSAFFEKNIHNNITKGNDFDDIDWLHNIGEFKYLDYLMRILPMAKMHILSESWDFKKGEYCSNYLSEKTYGFLLANIPFISTHSYPLDIIQKILKINNHPFYNEIKITNGDPEKFVEFVKSFMENFDKNYKLCKEWTILAHTKLIEIINNDNSLLDLVLNDFKSEVNLQKKLL